MDIAGVSMSTAQANLQTDVGIAMLSKTMDLADTTGAAIVNMIDSASMERSVNPHIGSNFDMSV